MLYSFTASESQLDRIERLLGSLTQLRVWAMLPGSPQDLMCVSCLVPESLESIIEIITVCR